MIWVKAFHVAFMVTWFAGLFYLPRLFVYHAMENTSEDMHQRYLVMERKLFAIMTMGAVLTALLGTWMLVSYGAALASGSGWLHAKLTLIFLLIGYHAYCYKIMVSFRKGTNRRGHVFYRWFNEFPVLLLFGIIILVVVRPF
ncbi:MAG: CopD family protein [Gammaproteobacteria bacterium]|nr:CopD family protein [Gammaproteobacteria bacterium]